MKTLLLILLGLLILDSFYRVLRRPKEYFKGLFAEGYRKTTARPLAVVIVSVIVFVIFYLI